MSSRQYKRIISQVYEESQRRFDLSAYAYMTRALSYKADRDREEGRFDSGHLTCEEVYNAFWQYALQEMGPLAWKVVNIWGIRTARDVGELVFQLIGAGILQGNDDDSIEAFIALPPLEKLLTDPYISA